ncbi:MAG TPA: putative nucleotidyltransferase substrate binding domain-containing protein [Alphaproteobacteria bacterium]
MNDTAGLKRLDSFPYRHRVADVMHTPAVTAPPAMTVAEGARRMHEAGVSSLVVVSGGRAAGIVTERDLLRTVAARGGDALGLSLSAIMSSPVHTLAPDVFVYVALARMARLGIRHLPVVDDENLVVGMVTAGGLLRQHAGAGLALADEVQQAAGPADMAAALKRLPTLATGLLAEGTSAREIAAVISAVIRDITARCAALAEAALVAEGQGPPPAAYACLVLGSAGRGESLLVPDQDNAVVHDGAEDDPWFALFGRRLADLLNDSGVPYCRGKVMASEPLWRHSLRGWQDLIDHWVRAPAPEDLLNVDIFFDFVPVCGDRALAKCLRAYATAAAARAPAFLRQLAEAMKSMHPPFGLLGGLRTDGGRIDLKRGGLLPIVTGARLMALRCASPETSTPARIAAAADAGALNAEDAAALTQGHELLLRLVLEQQIADLDAGVAPSNRVELGRLARPVRRRLRDVLRQVDNIEMNVRDVLTR